jgi:hypothetical protein
MPNKNENLLMTYEEGQDPIERLRNLLTPLLHSMSLLRSEDVKIVGPEILIENLEKEIIKADNLSEDIKNYLSDAETLYKNH